MVYSFIFGLKQYCIIGKYQIWTSVIHSYILCITRLIILTYYSFYLLIVLMHYKSI